MRIVEVRGRTIIGGGLLPFEHQLADKLIGMLAKTKKRIAKNAPAFFAELGLDAGDPEVGHLITSATDDAELLQVSAPLFSTLFLADLHSWPICSSAFWTRNSHSWPTATARRSNSSCSSTG